MFAPPRRAFPGARYGRGGGGANGNLGVFLLIANVMRIGLEHIPPITLGVIGLCTSLYLGIIPLARGFSSGNVCFNFMALATVLGWGSGSSGSGSNAAGFLSGIASGLFGSARARQATVSNLSTMTKKLALSNFFHANDFHLYYNMMSWLYKGRNYELVYGSEFMLLWLIAAVIGVSVMYCAICAFLLVVGIPALQQQMWLFGGDRGDLGSTLLSWLEPDACVVGFSSVIFCLKTVLNYHNVQAHGEIDEQIFIPFFGALFATPLRYAVWAELLVCQLFTPQVSFLGHLAGIVTGLLFIVIDLERWIRPIADGLRAMRRGVMAAGNRGADPRHERGWTPPPTPRPQPEAAPPRRGAYGGDPLHMPRGERGGFG